MGRKAEKTQPNDSDGGVSDWLIVGVIALILLVGPTILLVITPQQPATLAAYLVLSIITALAFGAIGVWTALQQGSTKS